MWSNICEMQTTVIQIIHKEINNWSYYRMTKWSNDLWNSIIITFSKNYKLNYRVSILFTSACKYLKHWSNCSMENESCLCLHSISKYLNLPWADNGGARIEETSILSFSSSQFPATRIWQNNNTPREKKKGNKLRTGQEEADIEKHHCLDFKNRRGNLT